MIVSFWHLLEHVKLYTVRCYLISLACIRSLLIQIRFEYLDFNLSIMEFGERYINRLRVCFTANQEHISNIVEDRLLLSMLPISSTDLDIR